MDTTNGTCEMSGSRDLKQDIISAMCLSGCGRFIGIGCLSGSAIILECKVGLSNVDASESLPSYETTSTRTFHY